MRKDETGVTFTGGQDELKGKIIRIGHMGYVNDFDIIVAIAALEKGLYEGWISCSIRQRASHSSIIACG